MSNSELLSICKALPYTAAGWREATSDTINETEKTLNSLRDKYGDPAVLGTLSGIWSVEEASVYFDKTLPAATQHEDIHTIGTLCFNMHDGGIQRVQAQLISLWTDMGYEVVLISEEDKNPADYDYPSSTKRITIPGPEDTPGRLKELDKAIGEYGIDILINNSWLNYSMVWEIALAHFRGIPYIQHTHSHYAWPYRYGRSALYTTRTFKLCDMVIALSPVSARFYQICGCKTYLVNNPVPTDIKAVSVPSDLTSGHIVMVGRLSPEKRPADALAIFGMVREACPEAVLDILGDGDESFVNDLRSYCNAHGLSDCVIFHGNCSPDQVNRYMHDSSMLLFTSEIEGYGMVLLEAKAHGLPIVMYDLPYLTLVQDRRGIRSSSIGDMRSMADMIIELLGKDDVRSDCGKASRESFEDFAAYDIEAAWNGIFDLCTDTGSGIRQDAYYDPEAVSIDEQIIDPLLLDGLSRGYETEKSISRDYVLGHKLLAIPRAIRKRFSS